MADFSKRQTKWYGWRPDLPDKRDLTYSVSVVEDLPPVQINTAWMPEVFSQGSLGSCVGNAVAGSCKYNFQKQESKSIFTPSRLFIYYNSRRIEGTTQFDAGAQIRDGIKSISQWGVCPESMWTYDIGKFGDKPTRACYSEALKWQAIEYRRVPQTLAQLKGCIASGFTFVFGFTAYESFESDDVERSGILPMPSAGEKSIGGHAVFCLSGDTKIPLLDGTEVNLRDLCNKTQGKEFWVYSCDEQGNVVPGKAHSLRKTGDNREMLEIVLDNGESVRCTPDHRFLMRDGNYKEAQCLLVGDSLMPLYRKKSKQKCMNGYEMVLNPGTRGWQYTHRRIAGWKSRYSGVVHHKNFNKTDNRPENLHVMSWDDHALLHREQMVVLEGYAKSDKGRNKSRELMSKLWANEEWRRKTLLRNAENGRKTSNKLALEGKCGFQSQDKEKLRKHGRRVGATAWKRLQEESNRIKSRDAIRANWKDPDFRTSHIESRIDRIQKYNASLKYGDVSITDAQRNARRQNALKLAQNKDARKRASLKTTWTRFYKDEYPVFEDYVKTREASVPNNHKVVDIRQVDSGDVYDLTVDGFHNFAVSAGVFVHNCFGFDDSKKAFYVRNSWGEDFGQCLSGETKISLLDGRDVPIADLAKDGRSVWIYSYDSKLDKILPSLAIPKCSGIRNDMLRITLDNGEFVVCTSDHLWMMRDGTYKKAMCLESGSSLMPLYRKDNNGYEAFYSPNKHKWLTTHWSIIRELDKRAISLEHAKRCMGRCDLVIHHANFNRHDNTPDNLVVMLNCQHHDFHREKGSINGKKVMAKLWGDRRDEMLGYCVATIRKYNNEIKTGEKVLTEKQIQSRREAGKMVGVLPKKQFTERQRETVRRNAKIMGDAPKTESHRSALSLALKKAYASGKIVMNEAQRKARSENAKRLCEKRWNHKVVSVERLNLDLPVYDLVVNSDSHNFALSAGVFVHNCGNFLMPYDYILDPDLAADFWTVRRMEI